MGPRRWSPTTTSWASRRRRSRRPCAISRPISDGTGSGSTRSAPGPSGRWPRRGSPASSGCTARLPRSRRCAPTSRPRTSGGPPCTSPRTCRAPSPARRSTSTAASTSWASPPATSRMRAVGGRAHTIRNVIWDVDGTLFDTYPAIARAFRAALGELGADDSEERIAHLARESLGHCMAALVADHGLDPARFEAAFGRHYDRVEPADQPLFPGVADVCRRIVELGGRNVIVTHRGPRGTAELLAAANLTHLF